MFLEKMTALWVNLGAMVVNMTASLVSMAAPVVRMAASAEGRLHMLDYWREAGSTLAHWRATILASVHPAARLRCP